MIFMQFNRNRIVIYSDYFLVNCQSANDERLQGYKLHIGHKLRRIKIDKTQLILLAA